MRRVNLHLDESDIAKLRALAKRGHVSVAWLVRKAIRDYLAAQKNEKR